MKEIAAMTPRDLFFTGSPASKSSTVSCASWGFQRPLRGEISDLNFSELNDLPLETVDDEVHILNGVLLRLLLAAQDEGLGKNTIRKLNRWVILKSHFEV